MEKKTYTALGLMSGTSLDGLDICCVTFDKKAPHYFNILNAKTVKYADEWSFRLRHAHLQEGFELMKLHHEFGVFCANTINDFLKDNKIEVDFIASHGHTVFHAPNQGFTTQIGSGAAIYAGTKIKTICDFRSVDVAFGGQGAPLVPIGDLLLFDQYQSCLNLGGISNISVKSDGKIKAQDLGYCNLLLNYICQEHFGSDYDKNGDLGRQGSVDTSLLEKMLAFNQEKNGKSLAREDFETFVAVAHQDKNTLLRTSYEYIASYLAIYLNDNKVTECLLTGGGTHNTFLVELTQSKTKTKLIVPSGQIIDFKEALIFAFLGLLRIESEVNCLESVTKATESNIGGAIYG